MDDLKYYFNLKKDKSLTSEDHKKIALINQYLERKEVFFYMDIGTIYGIFDFLEIPLDKRPIIYQQLISLESYKETFPINRMIKDENENNISK